MPFEADIKYINMATMPHSSRVQSSFLDLSYFLYIFSVLSFSMWVSSTFSSFLPLPELSLTFMLHRITFENKEKLFKQYFFLQSIFSFRVCFVFKGTGLDPSNKEKSGSLDGVNYMQVLSII